MIDKSNIFYLDKKRQEIAKKGDLEQLKKTYNQKRVINPNTSDFWDQKITTGLPFRQLDSMTKDRIKIAASYVKNSDRNILDIGLGYGYFEIYLHRKRKDINIHGLDISLEAVSRINKTIKGIFKQGSIQNIPFNKKFDAIIALEILEHIAADQIIYIYKEIKKRLKRKGTLVISVPINEKYTEKYNPNLHLRSYTKELIISELKIAGFEVVKYQLLYAFESLYLFKKILSKFFSNKWNPNIIVIQATPK